MKSRRILCYSMQSVKLRAKGYVVRYSDDGSRLVCLGNRVIVFDAVTGEQIWSERVAPHPSSATFSADGSLLAVKTTSGRIVVANAKTGDTLHDHRNGREGEGSNLCLSPDGQEIIDGSWKGVLTVRPILGGKVRIRETFKADMLRGVSHDLERRTWLVEHAPKAVVRGQPRTAASAYIFTRKWPFVKNRSRRLDLQADVNLSILSPDGTRICYLHPKGEHSLNIASVNDGAVIASTGPQPTNGYGRCITWSPDGRLIGCAIEGKFTFHRALDLSLLGQVEARFPSSIAFRPGTDEVALGTWNDTSIVRLRDVLKHDIKV